MPTTVGNAWKAFEEFCGVQDALNREVEEAIREIAGRYGYEADVSASWTTQFRSTESNFTVTWFEEGALAEALAEEAKRG